MVSRSNKQHFQEPLGEARQKVALVSPCTSQATKRVASKQARKPQARDLSNIRQQHLSVDQSIFHPPHRRVSEGYSFCFALINAVFPSSVQLFITTLPCPVLSYPALINDPLLRPQSTSPSARVAPCFCFALFLCCGPCRLVAPSRHKINSLSACFSQSSPGPGPGRNMLSNLHMAIGS